MLLCIVGSRLLGAVQSAQHLVRLGMHAVHAGRVDFDALRVGHQDEVVKAQFKCVAVL